ncbi:MAG: hypothetical protein A3K30_05210 [Deltaproteobacteria bacterium RBG_13_51_10]|nr:MAG: hypothetical protein A3K30_05210 [Deltaproteobacteria bacterium RBG_13_51_10]
MFAKMGLFSAWKKFKNSLPTNFKGNIYPFSHPRIYPSLKESISFFFPYPLTPTWSQIAPPITLPLLIFSKYLLSWLRCKRGTLRLALTNHLEFISENEK